MESYSLKILVDELDLLVSEYIDKYFNLIKISSLSRQSIKENLKQGFCFNIGPQVVNDPIISAPLAGISDNTYRIFARAFGCSLTFSEMVTSYGIYYNHMKSRELASITEYERPCAIQLFGCEPDIMA